MFTIGFAAGFVFAFVNVMMWHWYTLAKWSAVIREACGGKIPGYDDDERDGR